MAALKVAMASSSSSLCGKPHIVMDTWVRRIRTSSSCCSSSSSSSSSATRRKVGIRVLIQMTNTKGSTIINSKKGERMTVGWRMISCARVGGTQDKGLVGNWRKKSFSSQAKGFVADNMGSENKEQQNHHHHQQQQHQTQRLLTLPTILTIGRVAAVPLLVSTFYMNSQWATTVTTGIFIGAAITDWLDGYIARKMRLGTAFGAFLDPVADKLMVAATLVLLCTRPLDVTMFGEVPWLLPVPAIAIIGREITMSAVREWAASQNSKFLEAVAVNNLGKWKTATQMIALTILLATRDSSLIGSEILVPSGVVLLYVSAGLAVWSLAVYIKKIWRILLK